MNVVIRADSSVQMGSGHLMRCLTLAGELTGSGARVSFICRELPGNLCHMAEKKGYNVYHLPYAEQSTYNNIQQPDKDRWPGVDLEVDAEQVRTVLNKSGNTDWLVVDHYALDIRWESKIRPYVKNIMVIDDLANRPHDCDLLLDQNLYKNMETRYEGLVPDHCRKLLGPGYALLRPEFREVRRHLNERDGSIRRILVFFGGSDPTNETLKAVEALRLIERTDIAADVVLGVANPYKEEVRRICREIPNAVYHCQVENMAELMAGADLAIGAGGTSTWERCFLGLPAIVVVVAHNQYETAVAVADSGAARLLGWYHKINVVNLQEAIMRELENPAELRQIGKNALKLMGENLFDVQVMY